MLLPVSPMKQNAMSDRCLWVNSRIVINDGARHRASAISCGSGGGVADIRFDGALPAITNRLVTLTDPEIVIEVAGLPGEAIARGLVMNPSPDLRIGLAVRDTGGPIDVPVGEAVLGRMFNLFGETIDDGPPLGEMPRRPILRAPVPLSERGSRARSSRPGSRRSTC
jgi:F0F1-type ATP synthase beta subunit